MEYQVLLVVLRNSLYRPIVLPVLIFLWEIEEQYSTVNMCTVHPKFSYPPNVLFGKLHGIPGTTCGTRKFLVPAHSTTRTNTSS
jgi:hypothetical protein